MKILVVTSCTGEKKHKPPNQLTKDDFLSSEEHLSNRESELREYETSARDLYTGQQHLRLMRGIDYIRASNESNIELDLWILSAGYGLVHGSQGIFPYECTFQGMRKGEIKVLANHLHIPEDFRELLQNKYDLGFVLLGETYLDACDVTSGIELRQPTHFLCSKTIARKMSNIENCITLGFGNQEARKFSCGLVALKGEVVGRLLMLIARGNLDANSIPCDSESLVSTIGSISTTSVNMEHK